MIENVPATSGSDVCPYPAGPEYTCPDDGGGGGGGGERGGPIRNPTWREKILGGSNKGKRDPKEIARRKEEKRQKEEEKKVRKREKLAKKKGGAGAGVVITGQTGEN